MSVFNFFINLIFKCQLKATRIKFFKANKNIDLEKDERLRFRAAFWL